MVHENIQNQNPDENPNPNLKETRDQRIVRSAVLFGSAALIGAGVFLSAANDAPSESPSRVSTAEYSDNVDSLVTHHGSGTMMFNPKADLDASTIVYLQG